MAKPLVGLIMGSASDWETMQHAAQTLDALGLAYEKRVISAHRTPKLMYDWGTTARERGLKIVIAGAGGAAHLAGVAAALTPLPVLGVPMESASLKGLDSRGDLGHRQARCRQCRAFCRGHSCTG